MKPSISTDQSSTANRRGRTRRWSGLAGLGVAMALVAAMATAAISSLSLKGDVARAEIEARLSELTGLAVTVEGEANFTLLPKAQLSMTQIRVGPGNGKLDAVMQIDGMVADLDLWEALIGHTRVERLSLVRPELLSTAGFLQASAAAAQDGKGARVAPDRLAEPDRQDRHGYVEMSDYFGSFLSRFEDLRSIEIRDGVFRTADGGSAFGVSNANLVVSWPSKTSAARMSGSYIWNGQPTEIDLRLAAPIAFLGGDSSGIDLDISSPPLSIAFDGDGSIGGVGRFTGRLKVATPSLTRSIRWLGDPRAVMPEIGPLSIDAALDGVGRTLNLRDATVLLDGFAGQGAVEMRMAADGRPNVGGTLAFDRLDLTGFAEAVAPLPQNPLDLQRRISVDFIDQVDLDLRLSATRGTIGKLPIGDLAATVKFKDGVGTLDVGDAAVLGGRGQARITIDSRLRSPSAKGFASVSGIETSGLFQAIGVSTVGVSGLADISAEIETPITSWADLFKRNQMTLNVSARGGELSGFDPTVFLGNGTKPFTLATEPTAIPFDSLRATLATTGPLVNLKSIVLRNASGAFEASGVLSTATNQVDVSGSFEPQAGATASTAPDRVATPRPIDFRMSGEWPKPIVTSGLPSEPI